MSQWTFGKKHRVYKYGKHWYANCGHCARALWAGQWSACFGLLQFHVSETHGDG
jgi:hypothetical protein